LRFFSAWAHHASVLEGHRLAVEPGPAEIETAPGSGVIRNDLPLECVPRVAVSGSALCELPLDHRAGFILWLVDGKSAIGDIFDASPMPVQEVAEILRRLVAIGVIVLD